MLDTQPIQVISQQNSLGHRGPPQLPCDSDIGEYAQEIYPDGNGGAVAGNVLFLNEKKPPLAVPKWRVPASHTSQQCRNFIREIVDQLDLKPNPEKPVIALSIGDPTVYGNLKRSAEATEALVRAVCEGRHDGYTSSVGYEETRDAIAAYMSHDGVEMAPGDIMLASGCSSSLDMCIAVLANPGQNILMPRPGFPLYRTLADSMGIQVKMYDLIPERDWEVDLQHLSDQIDANTAAIIVNNPSNPCGSVYSKQHLLDILEIAEQRHVPIIADEIYEYLVFPGQEFVSLAALSQTVPVLVCGGLAKRFLVPGWRIGWIAVHDPIDGALDDVRRGLVALSQRTMGANTLVQGAIPAILADTPQQYHDDLINTLHTHAKLAFDILNAGRGWTPFMPSGAMYMMVRLEKEHFPQLGDGLQTVQKLMEEESVFPLPGEAFFLPGYMRIVLTVPADVLVEACQRMCAFSERHYVD